MKWRCDAQNQGDFLRKLRENGVSGENVAIPTCGALWVPRIQAMQFSISLDHLVVVARTLEEGAAYVEAVLGVELSPGGRHDVMGTHNRLLSLGGDAYLEVIAIDPRVERPKHWRWFNMDRYKGPPRMTNWVCATDDLEAALDKAPEGSGAPLDLVRGELSWRMAVPPEGQLPFDDAMPALIEWETDQHPKKMLPDHDLRLTRLDVFHPEAEALLEAFPALHRLELVSVREGPEKRLIASISTPEGIRVLA